MMRRQSRSALRVADITIVVTNQLAGAAMLHTLMTKDALSLIAFAAAFYVACWAWKHHDRLIKNEIEYHARFVHKLQRPLP